MQTPRRTLTTLAAAVALTLAVPGAAHAAPAPSAAVEVVTTPVVASPKATARSASRISLKASQTSVRKGELVWLSGKVTGAKPHGRKVVVERRKAGGAWKRYTTATTSRAGSFSQSVRPTGVYQYRARVAATSRATAAASPALTVTFSKGKRTLAQRAAVIGSARLGAPAAGVAALTGSQARATRATKVTRVQHRQYAKGMLVTVERGSTVRTWLVAGKILTAYRAQGGPTGRLGVPVADPKCGLVDKGCVQRFSRGTVYSSKAHARATVTTVTGAEGEVVAAARSHVGYRKKYAKQSVQHTKFNTWMGSTGAWCSFYQSWASAAAGRGSTIPKIAKFSTFRDTVRSRMKTGSKPKVGALVFFNTYPPAGVATHVGLVTAVKAGKITVIDGNTLGNLPAGTRGVLERTWPESRALYYAYPSY